MRHEARSAARAVFTRLRTYIFAFASGPGQWFGRQLAALHTQARIVCFAPLGPVHPAHSVCRTTTEERRRRPLPLLAADEVSETARRRYADPRPAGPLPATASATSSSTIRSSAASLFSGDPGASMIDASTPYRTGQTSRTSRAWPVRHMALPKLRLPPGPDRARKLDIDMIVLAARLPIQGAECRASIDWIEGRLRRRPAARGRHRALPNGYRGCPARRTFNPRKPARNGTSAGRPSQSGIVADDAVFLRQRLVRRHLYRGAEQVVEGRSAP